MQKRSRRLRPRISKSAGRTMCPGGWHNGPDVSRHISWTFAESAAVSTRSIADIVRLSPYSNLTQRFPLGYRFSPLASRFCYTALLRLNAARRVGCRNTPLVNTLASLQAMGEASPSGTRRLVIQPETGRMVPITGREMLMRKRASGDLCYSERSPPE